MGDFQAHGRHQTNLSFVVPGLVPGIHVFFGGVPKQGVDGRDKPGHDGVNKIRIASDQILLRDGIA
ncbi:hypothetical protein YH63_014825 [Afipia massiliensis]|uniref:Uncharacterized protein n=1 Tax=Afipia massiliensis TaxID=211460 RepID=A0A4U6BQ33_9BRAD|nr:hypothetical protein YH63_014825 [Afipia massiliensis]